MALYSKPSLINVVWAAGGDRVSPGEVKYSLGWLSEIPPRQYFNFIDWKQDQWIAYSNQIGIPEWDNNTEYQANKSIVQGSNGIVYQCLVTGVNINPVGDTQSRWRRTAIEDAPANGKQFVRVNNSWAEFNGSLYADKVHTHTTSQVVGLDADLGRKLNIAGEAPTLTSTARVTLVLQSSANTTNGVRGMTGGLDSWFIGRSDVTNNNLEISATLNGTRLTLRSDRLEANKNIYVGNNPVFHDGNRPKWNQIEDVPVNIGIPLGGIIIWSGAASAIPSGWALCDGTSGTPNLRDRFVVGAGGRWSVGGAGGSADAVVVSHTHTGTTGNNNVGHTHSGTTNSAGAHTHGVPTANGDSNNNRGALDPSNQSPIRSDTITTSAGAHTHSFTTAGQSANHNHAFTTAASGVAGTDKNLPPFYALCYIMRIN